MENLTRGLLSLVMVFLVLIACAPGATPVPAAPPGTVATSGPFLTPKAVTPAPGAPKPVVTAGPTVAPPATKPTVESPYFGGKTIEIIAATAAGGGTDFSARAIAAYLPKYIPGNPRVIVRNQPGADGVVAANSFFVNAKPDGLSLLHHGTGVIGSQQRRHEIARYDLLKMPAIGNIGVPGFVVVIRKGELSRLTDPKGQPVVMAIKSGTEPSNFIPLYGREFLGWNVRWVVGFGGTAESMLAFRRGEVDMFSPGGQTRALMKEGIIEPVAQVGSYKNGTFTRRSDFLDIPTFVEVLGDKKPTGLPWQAFVTAMTQLEIYKLTAAPPGTPDNVLKILRDAYRKMAGDTTFSNLLLKGFSETYEISIGEDTESLLRDAINVPPEAADYPDSLLRKFGVIK